MNFDTADRKFMNFLNTKKGIHLKVLATIAVIMAIFVTQLFFNHLTPLISDDYGYSFSCETGEKLFSVNQLIPSILKHNQTTNGRSTNHIVAQFFLIFTNYGYDIVFDVCNSSIYIALIFLIYYHSKGTFKNFRLWWFGAIHLCLWLFVPDYAGCFYWLIGSSNYCWSMVIALLFMIPFTYHSNKGTYNKPNIFVQLLLSVLYVPCGIIAGNTNENTAVAVVVMIILFGAKSVLEKKKLRIWMFSGLLGAFGGFAAMILSPGQQLRAEQSGGFGGIGAWIKNAVFITMDVFEYLALPLLLLFIAIILAFYSNKKLKFSSFFSFFIFLIGSGASIYCMVVSPQFPERSWTPPVIFAIIAFGQLLSLIKPTDKIYRRTICVALAIATICFGTSYIASYLDIKQTVIAYNEREAYIAEQKANGETVLVLNPVRGWMRYNLFGSGGDLGATSDEWRNEGIACYYGVEKVINSESREGIMYDIFE